MQKGKNAVYGAKKLQSFIALRLYFYFTKYPKIWIFFHPVTVKCDRWTEGQKDGRQKWQTLYDQAIIHMAEDKKNIKEIKC